MNQLKEKSEVNNDGSCRRTLRDISVRTMFLNIFLFYSVLGLGGYLLWIKSFPIFLVYSIIIVVSTAVHRYLICRSCFYYGRPCPSFGYSYIVRIFPKAEDKPFNGKAAGREVYITIAYLFLPVLALILSWVGVTDSYSLLEYILTGVYVVLFLSSYMVHEQTGCKKCEIQACPFSMAAKVGK